MKSIKFGLLLFFATIIGINTVSAQKTADEIKTMVESKSFVFKAETARPMRGGNQQLSAGYDVTITPNSIKAYLPFYGRAQTIPIGSTDGGIKFNSTNFQYEALPKKQGWRVTIKTIDVSNVKQLYLTIYDNGNATLDVMNINRDDISFNGYIR
jgi:hypothetical protein